MVWETGVQSQVVIPKTQKMLLDASCLSLSIIRYGSRVSGDNPGKEKHPPLHLSVVAIEKEPSDHP